MIGGVFATGLDLGGVLIVYFEMRESDQAEVNHKKDDYGLAQYGREAAWRQKLIDPPQNECQS